ncbi:MAG TPA: hypothetical protein VNO55_25635 [Polyangia bacterium]|nr:hypothetical protein [Polyangia bacterium]
MSRGRHVLKRQVQRYLDWLASAEGRAASPADAQRRFTLLRLRFNVVLSDLDIFSEALSQRSEADSGVWLAGLDVVARDALALPDFFEAPPVICYLARGPGAAIRRARTRLPAGGENPVAIIRVPRERMVGTGIASSLVHEVGHQGAALLDLVDSLRADLALRPSECDEGAWNLLRCWISEIVADLWSVARLGVTATAGLIGVVSLPSAFVFRIVPDDPHPAPYVRVKLSAAMGAAMYPHQHWDKLKKLWESFYEVERVGPQARALFQALESALPIFVLRLLEHRPAKLGGRSLREVLPSADRTPQRLAELYRVWSQRPQLMRRAAPTLVFAVLGQARADGELAPEREGDLLASLLRHWAWRSTVDVGEICATTQRSAGQKTQKVSPRIVAVG